MKARTVSSPLSRARRSPSNFLFQLVLFPAAYFLSGEGFSLITAIAGFTAVGRRVVNFLANPSLS
jgi:hypothetical protein